MDSVLNFGALTLLLLIGAFFVFGFVDFLRTRSSRHGMCHGDAFSADPKRTGPRKSLPSKYRNTTALLDRSLTAARQITSETARANSRWRAS
jgi:hypothetical protein